MAELDEQPNDQHFCLRWNNFQANITSQFEALRYNEDFTDVTIACEGQQLQAHKVVLSACSPYFKELFKANPCTHPIIFMRDVEARHIMALMEFMYVGEVNVSQTHLSAFLKTAESLKIRGLTDTSSESDAVPEENSLYLKPQPQRSVRNGLLVNKAKQKSPQISSTSTVTSSQDVSPDNATIPVPNSSSPTPKRQCKSETDIRNSAEMKPSLLPKVELPEYISDDENDNEQDDNSPNFYTGNDTSLLAGGVDIIPQSGNFGGKELGQEFISSGNNNRKLHSLDPRPCSECGKVYSNLSNLRQHMKLIHFPTYVTCGTCQKQFKTDLYLRRHIMSAHTGIEVRDSYPSSVNLRNGLSYRFGKNITFTRRNSAFKRDNT
ncbi:hypothetical protein GWI33_017317 [Rhynchophorus ferrugineus]|uniref:Uncharacterized protein n=1 Tax=Rhynchophorus ferrugineus TaxID=354439 RepID=A0A834HWX3_RHYFE|nr:hypothetical protein GWI33_017317 [Rhynchophorus ferrugineus]